MDIRHRLYPYPVLSDMTDDYTDSKFEMNLEVKKGLREISFLISLSLSNDEVQNLIDKKQAEYVVHIECPYTSYRTVIKTDTTKIEKNIPEHKLNSKVAVCAFIVAKTEIAGYHNNSFNEDYNDVFFDLNKGNIIAIGGQVNINITKETEELSKLPSIFTICRYADDTDEGMKIDIDGEKIAIILCNNSFQNYKLLVNNPSMLPVFHSLLIVPALIYTFETMKRVGTGEFEEQRWYKSIERTLRRHDIVLNKDTLENIPSFEFAQKLLDLPIDHALNTLVFDATDDEEE